MTWFLAEARPLADLTAAKRAWVPVALVTGGALALYGLTLAPGLLWGDQAQLQRLAAVGGSVWEARGHIVWYVLARAWVGLLPGQPAFLANLLSAVLGVLAVGVLALAARAVGAGLWSAAAAAWIFALSHTMWLQSVQAEVYSLQMLLHGVVVLAAAMVVRGGAVKWAGVAGAGLGLAALNHPWAVLLLPAFLYALVVSPRLGRARWLALGGLVGFVPYGLGLMAGWVPGAAEVWSGLRPEVLARNLVLGTLFTGYQFAWFLLLLPLAGLALLRRKPAGILLALLYAPAAVFALVYQVQEQYLHYLPSYQALGLALAFGLETLAGRVTGRRLPAAAVAVASVALILFYRAMPSWLGSPVAPRLASEVPYRDSAGFFLYPPKSGHEGARQFAEEALDGLAPEALLIADWTLLQPILYLQEVEGRRPDVEAVEVYEGTGIQLPLIQANVRRRPVYLAGTNRYYEVEEIRASFELEPDGLVWRVTPCRRSYCAGRERAR